MKRGQASSDRRRLGPAGPSKKLPKTPQRVTPARKQVKPPSPEHRDEEGSPAKSPVRYITEGLIKQSTGKQNVGDVLSIRLSVRKDDGKKIRFIENLEGCRRLQVLNLSFNQIQKMERLAHLTRLRDLDLSCNCIARIEGLQTLSHLQTLNLSHNLIESLPAWMGKKLKALREFHIEGNLLFSLSDISRLRPLKDMISLTMSANPLSDLAHYRLYAVFHLRSLGVLDGQKITEQERSQAEERFAQEEIENLEVELEARAKRYEALEADHGAALNDKKKTETKAEMLKKKAHASEERTTELEDELKAKDELLRRKTAELTKACEKQFRLEQELAFHKIDAKFEPLPNAAFVDQVDGGTEESPYIGRASYRRNEFASEQYLTPRSQQLRFHHTPEGGDIDPSVKRQLNETLDNTLADKEKQIARAEERLENLLKQLDNLDEQVRLANEKLRMAEQIKDTKPPMAEEERHRLEGVLAERLRVVIGLKDRVAQLEEGMQTTLDIIEAKDREMAELRRQLAMLEDGDPRQVELEAQLADRELQAAQAARNYANLQHDLDNTLARLTDEMDRVKGLEQQLADGQADLNDELRTELQGIVGSLTDYLNQVKGQVADQQRENARLQLERDELMHRLDDAEKARNLEGQKELDDLQKRLRDAEDALEAFEAENDALREITKSEPEKDAKLRAALDQANKLKDALRKQQKQAQADKAALEAELQARREEAERAANQASQAGDQEAEARARAKQLADAQAANRSLRDRLREQQIQYDDLLNTSLQPQEVAERITHAGDSIAGQGDDGSPPPPGPQGEGDLVGESLVGLQGQVIGKLRQVQQEADRAKRYQQKAEGEAKSLRHQLEQMQARLRDMAARDQAHGRRHDTDREDEEEMERMRKELGRLKEALRKAEHQKPAAKPVVQPQPIIVTQPDNGSAPPAIDPRVRDEMHRLKEDMSGLKNQLKHKDRMAAQQLADAEKEILQLQAELRQRDREAREGERARQRGLDRQAREAEIQQASALAQAEVEGGQLAQKAIAELAKAQSEIDDLEDVLANRERELSETLRQGETTSQAMADQQEEIGALHDVLGAQRDEILRLQDLLHGLTGEQQPTGPQTAVDLQNLLGEIEALRQTLNGQQHHVGSRGPSWGAPMGPTPNGGGYQSGPPFNMPNGTTMAPPPQTHPPPPSSFVHHDHGTMNQTGGSYVGYPTHGSSMAPPPMMAPIGTNNQPSVRFAPSAPPMQPTAPMAPSQIQPMPMGVPGQPSMAPSGLHSVPPHTSAMPMGGTAGGQTVHHTPAQHLRVEDHTIQDSRRGKLRRVEGPVEGLFCNVPEHHDLEDENDRLRKRLEKLKRAKLDRRSSGPSEHGSKLRRDVLSKREELDALDLAVSRQEGALRRLREDDVDLRNRTEAKLRELRELGRAVDDRRTRRDFLEGRLRSEPLEEDFDLLDERLLERSGFLEDEIECLEETVARRRAELREADRLLVQCQSDLHEAQDKASEMLQKYDEASRSLALTQEERAELEQRSHELAVELVRAQEQLGSMQEEVADLEGRRSNAERGAAEMEALLNARETEFRAVEAKRDQSSKRLEKLKSEVIMAEQRLSELQASLRDGERQQTNRQSQLDRLQDQLDQQQHALEQVNRDVGAKQTDLRTLTAEVDKHRHHLVSALEDGESEIAATQQKIKDAKAQLERLKQQCDEAAEAVDERRGELSRLHSRVGDTEGALHGVQSAIDKQKAELKHTLEMVQIEKTELEALRLQHETKMAELEKTQLAGLQEKVSLEKLTEEAQQSRRDAERMREEARRVKEERDGAMVERRSLEEGIQGLSREEGALRQGCDTLQSKIRDLKTTHGETIESLHLNRAKLEGVQQDLVVMETELEDTKKRKSELVRELQNLKHHVKENRSELRQTNSSVEEASSHQTRLQEELEGLVRQKAQLSSQLDQLSQSLGQHRATLEECEREEASKQEALRMMGMELEGKKAELSERLRDLENVKEKATEEENRLSKLLRREAREKETHEAQLSRRQRELESLTARKDTVQATFQEHRAGLERLEDMERRIKELENQISAEEDKRLMLQSELEAAKIQTASLEKEKEHIESDKTHSEQEVQKLKTRWTNAQKDFRAEHRKLMQEIETLKMSLEEETRHAGRMGKEVETWRQEYLNIKQQLHAREDAADREKQLDSRLHDLRSEIQTEVSDGLRSLELSRLEVLDELQEVHHQKAEINQKLSSHRQVKFEAFQAEKENSKRKQMDLEFQLQQEQDLLKLRLEQQMTRQSEVLAGIKLKSESTIQSLRHKLDHLEDLVGSNAASHTQSLQESFGISERQERHVSLLPLSDVAGDPIGEVSKQDMPLLPDSQLTDQNRRLGVDSTSDDDLNRRGDARGTRNGESVGEINESKDGALSIDELRTRDVVVHNRVTFRERRRDAVMGRGEGGQPRSILKRRVPSDERRDALEYRAGERDGSPDHLRGVRRSSEDLFSSQIEDVPLQRPRSHSYQHQRRSSRSPVRRRPLAPASPQVPERGPPSNHHWSDFMDSLNQLKSQKLAQLNTNAWDHR